MIGLDCETVECAVESISVGNGLSYRRRLHATRWFWWIQLVITDRG